MHMEHWRYSKLGRWPVFAAIVLFAGTALLAQQDSKNQISSLPDRNDSLRQQLPPALIATIDSSPVPVLLPSDPELLDGISVVVDDSSYSAVVLPRSKGISLTITGQDFRHARSSTVTSASPPTDTIRGVPADIRRDEAGIWWLSWRQYDTANLVLLSCDSRISTLCADDDYLRTFASSLTYVGGNRAKQYR